MAGTNGSNGNGAKIGTEKVKQGLAQMLKGGVIVSDFLYTRLHFTQALPIYARTLCQNELN